MNAKTQAILPGCRRVPEGAECRRPFLTDGGRGTHLKGCSLPARGGAGVPVLLYGTGTLRGEFPVLPDRPDARRATAVCPVGPGGA